MAASFVLGSHTSSTYPTGYASGVSFACGLAREVARLGAPGAGGCNTGPF
jgi:hypothetical protein